MGKTMIVERPSQEYIDKKVKEARQKESMARKNRIYQNGGTNKPNGSDYYKTL